MPKFADAAISIALTELIYFQSTMDEKDVERESEMSKVGVAPKEYFPTFGDGNVRSVFPGIDGNGNSRSPLAWRGLLFAGRGQHSW